MIHFSSTPSQAMERNLLGCMIQSRLAAMMLGETFLFDVFRDWTWVLFDDCGFMSRLWIFDQLVLGPTLHWR